MWHLQNLFHLGRRGRLPYVGAASRRTMAEVLQVPHMLERLGISRKRAHYIYLYLSYQFFTERWRTFVSVDGSDPVDIAMGRHPWHRDFCADCFPFARDGQLYLFYETVNQQHKGLLGCFKYDQGAWRQLGPVLEQPWHMSYPQVFEEDGHVYMIPEQSNRGKGDVSLYEATEFPKGWVKRSTLINRPFADSTLYVKDNHYYLACYTIPPHESAELWHAPSMLGPWERHPQWQNINQSKRLRRCGGRFLEENGQLYRVAQDCNGGYGKRLFKVPVLKLSPTEYAEGSAALLMGTSGRRERGRHTYNQVDWLGKSVVCYDCKTDKLKPIGAIVRFFWGYLRRCLRI